MMCGDENTHAIYDTMRVMRRVGEPKLVFQSISTYDMPLTILY